MGIIGGDKAKQFSLHQMWNWNATRYCAIRLDHTERPTKTLSIVEKLGCIFSKKLLCT